MKQIQGNKSLSIEKESSSRRTRKVATAELATVPEAVEDIRQGRMVIVVDDPGRENEGDLVCAAEKVTPEIINFMAKFGRGLICLPIIGNRLDELGIEQMVTNPEESHDASFAVSTDAKHGTTTGISAHDRAVTIKTILASCPIKRVAPLSHGSITAASRPRSMSSTFRPTGGHSGDPAEWPYATH